MSELERAYNKRFKDQELSNDDFETDGLWRDIVEDLDGSKFIGVTKGKLLLSLFSAILFGCFLAYLMLNDRTELLESLNKEEEVLVQSITSKTKVEFATGKTVNEINQEVKTILAPLPAFGDNEKNESLLEEQEKQINSKPDPRLETKVASEQALKIIDQQEYVPNANDELQAKGNSLEDDTELKKESIAVQEVNNQNKNEFNQIGLESSSPPTLHKANFLPLRFSLLEYDLFSPTNLVLEIDKTFESGSVGSAFDEKDKTSSVWQIGAWGGANLTSLNYKTGNSLDSLALKNETEKSAIGSSFGFRASVLKNDQWVVSSGLEYHKLWTTFEYIEQTVDQVNVEDQVLIIRFDAATGDTLSTEVGTAIVNQTTTRNVMHRNEYNQFTVPFEFGFHKTNSKLVYGISAGAAFSFTTSQIGKTIGSDLQITEFTEDDLVAPFKPFSVGLRVRPFVGYQLSRNMTLSLSPQWTGLTGMNFDGTDIKLNIHQFNFNVGLVYSLVK